MWEWRASSHVHPQWQQRPTSLQCKPQGRFCLADSCCLHLWALLDRVGVTSSRVLKLWQTASAWELLMNSLACTPAGGMLLWFSTIFCPWWPAPLKMCASVHNCLSWLGVLELKGPWQSVAMVSKVCYTLESTLDLLQTNFCFPTQAFNL